MRKVQKAYFFLVLNVIFLLFVHGDIAIKHFRAEEIQLEEISQVPKEKRPDKFYEWTKTIFELIDQLESLDSQEQKQAFEQLQQIGLPVIPFLVDKLKSKGVYLDLICQIQAEQFNSLSKMHQGGNSQIVVDALKGIVSQKELSAIEKYYYGKYLQALQLFRLEKYQQAIGMINAIRLLEPKTSCRSALKQLKIKCGEQLLQQKILKATLIASKEIYERGDQIKITLSLENLTLAPVEVSLGEMKLAVLYVTVAEYGPLGDFNSISRMEELELPAEDIKINPSDMWKTTFVVDTSRDNPQSINYATYTINLEIRPKKLKSISGETIRKITTPMLTLKVFPPDVDPVLQNPLKSLGKALDGGIPIDIFLCALLVPKKDYEKGLALLMPALKNSDEQTKKVIMNCLKHITGLPFAIDKRVWLDWWQDRQKKESKHDKN